MISYLKNYPNWDVNLYKKRVFELWYTVQKTDSILLRIHELHDYQQASRIFKHSILYRKGFCGTLQCRYTVSQYMLPKLVNNGLMRKFVMPEMQKNKWRADNATDKQRLKILVFLDTDDRSCSYYTTVLEVITRLHNDFDFTVARTIERDKKLILGWEGDLIWARCPSFRAAKILLLKPDYQNRIITSITIGGDETNPIVHSFMQRHKAAGGNHRAVFIQNAAIRDLLKVYDVQSKAYFVPNGVDIDRFKPSALKADFVVGFAGKYGDMRTDKGFLEFYKPACEELHLKQLVADRQYARERTSVFGRGSVPHRKMHKFYQRISVLMQLSIFESCSNTVMEAMASGIPCIISKVGYHGEACEHNKNILFVERDLNQVKKALMRLRDDRGLYDRIARGARAFAEQHSWDRQAQKMKEVFDELLDHTQQQDTGARSA